MSYRKKTGREYAKHVKRIPYPKPWLGWRKKKCKVCKAPFLLGPFDPDVEVCPLHAIAGKEKGVD